MNFYAGDYRRPPFKLLLAMKLTAVFMLCFCLGAWAGGHAQVTVSISVKSARIDKVFADIEQQTGYRFIYSQKQVEQSKPVTLDIKDQPLETALKTIFNNQPFSFTFREKYIVVQSRTGNGEDKSKRNAATAKQPFLTITGKVVDAEGNPLSGATVANKNNNNSTRTDNQGKFSIRGEVGDLIVVSFVGFGVFSVKVTENNAANLMVKLTPEVSSEAVVEVNAGYYKVRKAEQTGSIGRVDAKTIEKQPVTNPIATLAGRAPGVFVQQTTGVPGGDFKIQIRGRNSLRLDANEPLYIIDGVPFSNEKLSSLALSSTAFNGGVASPLSGINISDIENIEILRDADATAIYGSRGANGVVLITTKNGKSGKTKLGVDAFYGIGKTAKIELLDTRQYISLRKEAFANDGLNPSSDRLHAGYAPDLTIWDTLHYTDWQRYFLGHLPSTTSVQTSLSGGSQNTQFIFSGGFRKETPVYPGDFKYQKSSMHLAVNHSSANKRFTANINVSGSIDVNNQPAADISGDTRYLPPNAPSLQKENGELNWANSTWPAGNPLAPLLQTYDSKTNTLVTAATLSYEILSGLKLKISSGFTNTSSRELRTIPSTIYDPARNLDSKSSLVYSLDGNNQSWIAEPQLNWDRNISRGKLTTLIGTTFQNIDFERKVLQYLGFASNALLHDLGAADKVTMNDYRDTKYRYDAVFGRINYNWLEKYIINLTGRRDGSSRFGSGKQFANFGAIGAAWVFSKEPFFERYRHVLNFAKLRSSFGTTGSDKIGDYQYVDSYTSTNNYYQGITGVAPSRLYNPDYAWETNRKFEIALELGLFADRLQFTSAYFRNRSSNQLVDFTLPLTTGFQGILSNFPATVQNTGIELELNTINVRNKTLRWSTSFNITVPDNKLVAFPGLEVSTYSNQYVIGRPLSISRVYEYIGVDSQSGYYSFRDFNGDGKISSADDAKSFVFIGQRWFGGINNNFSWKNFSLDIFFQFVNQMGNDPSYSVGIESFVNLPAAILKERIWRKPGDIADIQRLSTKNNEEANRAAVLYGYSNAVITDASYIRCKNLSFSYQFAQKWMPGGSCRFYIHAQNLFVITSYHYYDPETQTALPPLRLYTAGVQLKL